MEFENIVFFLQRGRFVSIVFVMFCKFKEYMDFYYKVLFFLVSVVYFSYVIFV